jgi:KipI family sensor histidine kinase inhibitor
MRWTPLGDAAVLLSLPKQAAVGAIAKQIEKARPAGLIECVPAFDSIAICYDPIRVTPAALMAGLAKALARGAKMKSGAKSGREISIPVCYGETYGPDLADVAARARLDPAQVIKLHAARRYLVRAIGFMPGFPYLSGLDARLHTPRRATPRTQIPAGSVGIGGAQTGVYPLASPGGWNLIGRTPLALFRPANTERPTLLQPGDFVRFKAISQEEFAKWR